MKNSVLLAFCTLLFLTGFSQDGKQQYKVAIVGFYNLENLYDTVDNPVVNDEEFLPSGPRNYNTRIYLDKLNKLATVISQMGIDMNPDGPALLGVAEIENDTVLTDLANHPLLRKRDYRIVHFDSKDIRGVDVAMYYNPRYFTVLQSDKLFVQLPGGSKDSYFTVKVCHWRNSSESFHVAPLPVSPEKIPPCGASLFRENNLSGARLNLPIS